jgi:hypothetical protein
MKKEPKPTPTEEIGVDQPSEPEPRAEDDERKPATGLIGAGKGVDPRYVSQR